MIGRPALSRKYMYLILNTPSLSVKVQPRFGEASTMDGTVLFSLAVTQMEDACLVQDDEITLNPKNSVDAKATTRSSSIDIPLFDKMQRRTRMYTGLPGVTT